MAVGFGLHFSCSSVTGGDWPDLYQAALDQAQIAESLGFECAVVSEHHFMQDGWIPSPMILCGALAAVTRRVRVGTDIVVLPLHHPISVAEDHVVLDNLSRGRAICAVGLGARKPEFDAYGVPFKQRPSRTEEAMAVIGRLMSEENVTHEGRYFRFEGVTLTPRPVQSPRPPLWYGAIAEPGARRAARLADALVIGPGPGLAKCIAMRAAYEEELAARGKDPRRGRVILRREAWIAPDARQARDEAIGPLRFQYSQVYTHLDPRATDEVVQQYAKDRFIIGGPQEFIEEVRRYREALGTGLVLFRLQLPGLPQEKVSQATRLLGERVLPFV